MTDNYINRMVDKKELLSRTADEWKINERIQIVSDLKDSFSNTDKENFQMWLRDQENILEWTSIADHFRPESDE